MATGCSLVAPGLVATVAGQVPTFSYRQTGHSNDYLGVQMTYLTGTRTCYGAAPTFTPYITNSAEGFSRNCFWNYRSAESYTALLCSVSVTDVPDGPLTITYRDAAANTAGPRAFVASFGESPAALTVTSTTVATSNTVASTTASPLPASTVTVTQSGSAITQTSTVQVTQPTTSTSTVRVSSCSTPSSSSIRSSSSTSPSASPSSSSSSRASSSSPSPSPSPSTSSISSSPSPSSSSSSRASSSSPSASPSSSAPSSSSSSSPTPSPSSSNSSRASSSSPSPSLSSFLSSSSSSAQASSSPPAASSSQLSSASPSSSSLSTSPSPSSFSSTPRSSSASSSSSSSTVSSSSSSSSASPVTRSSSSSSAPAPSSSSPSPSALPSSFSSPAPTPSSSSSVSVPASSSSAAVSTSIAPSPSSTTAASSSDSSSATSASSSPVPRPSSPVVSTCPAADGTTFSTPQGDFVIECYIDRFNSDLAITSPAPADYATCIEACASNPQCQAASYLPNGPCYLKSGLGAPSNNSNVWGVRRVSGPSSTVPLVPASSASTTSASLPSSSAVSCPGSNDALIATSKGTFQLECYVDRNRFDMTDSPVYPGSYEGCIAACASRDGCVQVSYSLGGPCYLKNGVSNPVKNGNIIGGRLVTGDSSSDTDVPSTDNTCPSADGKTFTTECGATYAIECASDRYGNDLPVPVPYVNNLGECLKACDETSGCIDVSYVDESPGPCYLKGAIGPIRPNSNIWGGLQLTGCTSNPQPKLKLHRKRVVHEKRPVQKRGIPIGPDFTYVATTTTVTRTSTSVVTTSTATITPARSGATTTTVYTTVVTTGTVTQTVLSTAVVQTTVTTCPTAAVF